MKIEKLVVWHISMTFVVVLCVCQCNNDTCKCESKHYVVANVSNFQLPRLFERIHSTPPVVHPWPVKVYTLKLCGTCTSSWTSNVVFHLSKCCISMALCDCPKRKSWGFFLMSFLMRNYELHEFSRGILDTSRGLMRRKKPHEKFSCSRLLKECSWDVTDCSWVFRFLPAPVTW